MQAKVLFLQIYKIYSTIESFIENNLTAKGMSDTVQRIKEYIEYKRISIRKFEESIGFSNGAFSNQYKNRKAIGVDRVEKIVQVYTDLDPAWLITGKGSMLINRYADAEGVHSPNRVSESDIEYGNKENYQLKYIYELERQLDLLRKDIKQKQEIIHGFLTGGIVKTK
ncbi:MAG: hypothetical protein RL662_1735 [Bacteroidota bacterium]|jgi:antitoxin component HigA of HigAB toxin-antitoxin module